jgi:hypothetical protein
MSRNDLYTVAFSAAQLFLFGKIAPLIQQIITSRVFSTGQLLNVVCLVLISIAVFLFSQNVFTLLRCFQQSQDSRITTWLNKVATNSAVLLGIVLSVTVLVNF